MLEVAKSFLQNILIVSILRWIPVKGKEYVVKVIFKAIGKLSANIFTMRDVDQYALPGFTCSLTGFSSDQHL